MRCPHKRRIGTIKPREICRHHQLRRIQFDIERDRDATLVIVPEHISNWPRIVSVPVSGLREASSALARIGEQINDYEPEKTG